MREKARWPPELGFKGNPLIVSRNDHRCKSRTKEGSPTRAAKEARSGNSRKGPCDESLLTVLREGPPEQWGQKKSHRSEAETTFQVH